MSFICNGCGKQSNTEIFISTDLLRLFNYALGSSNIFCKECTIKLYGYMLGFEKDKDIKNESEAQHPH